MGRSFRIGRIAGIPIGVSPLWLVIVALITWSLGASYYPSQIHGLAPVAAYALGLASALLLFASILAHEFGHALVARRSGIEVDEIDLWLLGGVARMHGRPERAGDELRFALAGPAVTAVAAALFGMLAALLPTSASPTLRAVVDYQLEINLIILGFNLIPAFPLDGGRVARALLWQRSGDLDRATATAALLGRWFGYGLAAFGVLLAMSGAASGLWFTVIGVFLVVAAGAERMQEQVVHRFTGIRAEELMRRPAIVIAASSSLRDAEEDFVRYRFTAFPVVGADGRALGLLSLNALEHIRVSARATTSVAQAADRDAALLVARGADVGELLEQPAFARIGRAAVLDEDGRPVGVISVTDIERTVRAGRLREPPRGHTGRAALSSNHQH